MGVNYGTYGAPRLDLGVAFWEHLSDMSEFIASQVLPFFRTEKKAASYSAMSRETILQDRPASRAARSKYNRIETEAEDKTYSCKEFGLEHPVDDSERSLYASDFDAEDAATRIVARALALQREKRVAAAIQNTTTFTGAALFTDNSASPWATITTDIIGQVLAAKEKVRANTGMVANALVVDEINLLNMLKNTGIKAQFPGAPLITLDMIKAALVSIFGLRKLIVGGAVRNSAAEGQAGVIANVWTDVHVMVALVAEESDGLATPCLGRSFLWVPDSPNPITVEMYREEQVRGDIVRARHNVDEAVIEPMFGHLMDVKA